MYGGDSCLCNKSVINIPHKSNSNVPEIVTTCFYFCAKIQWLFQSSGRFPVRLVRDSMQVRKEESTVKRKQVLVMSLAFLASLWVEAAQGDRLYSTERENAVIEDENLKKGVLEGLVTDKSSGEPLPFAAVQIDGTALGAVTGLDGLYTFNLAPGTYSIKVSFTSYETRIIPNVRIVAGQSTHLDVAMASVATELKEVKVTARRVRHTDAAVLSTMKQADVVATGASSQLISRSQSKDAAEVVSKLPGVSVEEGGMVNVRGLNVRYNTVLLNGTTAPGTENDSRAFALDVIAGNAIDHLMLYKTASAEFPADFSGGLVSIVTKSMPAEDALSFSYNIGVNTASIGKDFVHYHGNGADAVGFGGASRHLPAGFPSDISQASNAEKAEYARQLDNDWATSTRTSLPSQGFSMQWDKSAMVGKDKDVKFGSLFALNYGYENTVREAFENNRFGVFDLINEQPRYLNAYTDEDYGTKVKLNALGNIGFQFEDGSRFEFKNLFSQNAQDKTAFRQGIDYNNDYHIREQEYIYTQRSLYLGQLLYTHEPAKGHKLDYRLTYGFTNRQEPDRRLVTFRQQTDPSMPNYEMYKATDVNRFYQDMDEHLVAGGIDYKGLLVDKAVKMELLAGAAAQYKNRAFDGRKFLYTAGFPSTLPSDFLFGDLNEIFQPENLRPDGYFIDENTRKSDAYTATTFIPAAYVSFKVQVGGWHLAAGARAEYERTVLNGYTADGSMPVQVNRSELNVFPSFNGSYHFNEKHIVRAAYAYTINRPELREIAPYVYYDFDQFADYTGNTDLKNAKIQNVDLRYEFYPSPKELISVGAFYKHFRDPIEVSYIRSSGGNAIYTFKNADFAYTTGVELELRKNLDFMKLKNFSLVVNAAWIYSQVRFRDEDFDRDRAMQGQSPYLVNAGLFYENKGWVLSLMYGRYGRRILAVGEVFQNPDEDIPDIYEMPRNDLSFGLKKSIGKHWEIKFLASNLLNQDYTECQFAHYTDSEGVGHTVTQTPRSYKLGVEFQLGVTFKL